MRSLLRVLPDTSGLLVAGDVDQLPSVGPGQVLADVIASGAVPVVRLTEVFRQTAQSRVVVNAHRINGEEGELTVSFDGRPVVYGYGELDELVLAYATTNHKAQGSEYPAVVIPLTAQHYTMLARNLLYTGVIRGKRLVVLVVLVVLVGQRRSLAVAVRNASGRRRWSKLRVWLVPVSSALS